jgi:hypothetical protein
VEEEEEARSAGEAAVEEGSYWRVGWSELVIYNSDRSTFFSSFIRIAKNKIAT